MIPSSAPQFSSTAPSPVAQSMARGAAGTPAAGAGEAGAEASRAGFAAVFGALADDSGKNPVEADTAADETGTPPAPGPAEAALRLANRAATGKTGKNLPGLLPAEPGEADSPALAGEAQSDQAEADNADAPVPAPGDDAGLANLPSALAATLALLAPAPSAGPAPGPAPPEASPALMATAAPAGKAPFPGQPTPQAQGLGADTFAAQPPAGPAGPASPVLPDAPTSGPARVRAGDLLARAGMVGAKETGANPLPATADVLAGRTEGLPATLAPSSAPAATVAAPFRLPPSAAESGAPASTAAQPSPHSSDAEAPASPAIGGDTAPTAFAPAGLVSTTTAPAMPATHGPGVTLNAPRDVEQLVERLAAAREAQGGDSVRATVRHADFGAVALDFRSDEGRLSVTLTARDAALAPAVQAAASAAAGDSQPGDDASRRGAERGAAFARSQADDGTSAASSGPGQDLAGRGGSGRTASGQTDEQPADRRGSPPDGVARAAGRPAPQAPAPPSRRSGLYV